ncbi:AT-rich interactive domain-containing protein 3 [Ananas comosus]|uniref:AT-rich interactive domain-containing protein 3 n=1 Tax=Ananas comosus TaxID=4615 RepID=A0A199VB61_ANACO|nr:AT-rich interactive domain-containing protein 3 [Ananas comosus]
MSEAKDGGHPGREMLEHSEGDQIEEEVEEDEDLSALIENPLVEENPSLSTYAFPEAFQKPDSAGQRESRDQNDPSDARTDKGNDLVNAQSEDKEAVRAVADKEDNCLLLKQEVKGEGDENAANAEGSNQSVAFDPFLEGEGSGSEEEQAEFMKELEKFHIEHNLEFKPPKFYGEGLNCLKLWRQVTRLGGYDQVTSCKLWRQVGEAFRPPKTCTTVSWTFRIFYEKALFEYEKHKIRTGQLQVPVSSVPEPMVVDHQVGGNQSSGSGRTRRDAAARAMQGWHSQRLLSNGEVGEPIIKDKSSLPLPKRDRSGKKIGAHKKKKATSAERTAKVNHTNVIRSQSDSMVVDVGAAADWVKINVRKTNDCYEIYALIPGLLREEVHVQSDPAGRLVISGNPEQPDNPWGVTAFKKVITLPSRIDPHQTSAVVTLHGQLFVRAPFERSDT